MNTAACGISYRMRNVRLGILLVVSILVVAPARASVIARHRPMHPDNTQPVTFEASATMADRVILSYERSTLSTAPDGTHVLTPAEPETTMKECNPRGSSSTFTCTHTMPFAFPANSLITFTARAFDIEGTSTEKYAFAAGDYPWPDDPIPIRLKGDTVSKLDTVFIPDADITVTDFRDRLDEVIELFFRYDPILRWRGMHNFWYSGQQGNYEEFCKFTNPPNMANLTAIADAVAFLHTTVLRDCSNIPRMSSEIDDDKTMVHESAHTLYGLQDEYCCNTKYKPQPCAPNIYDSLASCEADAPALGYAASDCTQLSGGTTTLNVWRIDPSTEPACIMGPNQNKASSLFRAACERRLQWRYGKCSGGNCFPSTECP